MGNGGPPKLPRKSLNGVVTKSGPIHPMGTHILYGQINTNKKTAQHHHQSHICKEQPSKVPKDVVERLSHATNPTIRNAEVIAPTVHYQIHIALQHVSCAWVEITGTPCILLHKSSLRTAVLYFAGAPIPVCLLAMQLVSCSPR